MTVIAMSRTEIDRISVLQDLAANRIKGADAAALIGLGGAKYSGWRRPAANKALKPWSRAGGQPSTVINGLTFDGATKDPMQQAVRDALIGFLAATAQANAEAIKEAQRGGIALAKAKEGETKYRGRKPSYTRDQLVNDMLGQSAGIGEIAKATSLSRQAICRIKDDFAAAEAVLANWSKQTSAQAM